MRNILSNMIKQWPIQVTVLAMAFGITIVGLLFQYAPVLYTYHYYSISGLTFAENTRRIELIEQSIDSPVALSSMSAKDIELMLRKPSLIRSEDNIQAWHYHGDSCAIDIYFKDGGKRADYIEFRALTLNNSVSEQFKDTNDTYKNQYCIKAVLAAQGIDTPSSYALRPIPTTVSPYSS